MSQEIIIWKNYCSWLRILLTWQPINVRIFLSNLYERKRQDTEQFFQDSLKAENDFRSFLDNVIIKAPIF